MIRHDGDGGEGIHGRAASEAWCSSKRDLKQRNLGPGALGRGGVSHFHGLHPAPLTWMNYTPEFQALYIVSAGGRQMEVCQHSLAWLSHLLRKAKEQARPGAWGLVASSGWAGGTSLDKAANNGAMWCCSGLTPGQRK